MSAIAFAHLCKHYRTQTALDDLTFEVAEGSVCALLGPNGAGKTTAFKCLLGLTRPTSGSASVGAHAVGPETFVDLAYVADRPLLEEHLSVDEHLAVARRIAPRFDLARANELVATFGLPRRRAVRTFSKGQQTAVSLVLAFAIRPRTLILDEPSSGLDPIFQRTVLDLIIDAAAGGATVLISSHQIGQIERAADHVAILQRGKLVLAGEIDALKERERIVEAIFENDAPALDGLASNPDVRRIDRTGRLLRVYVRANGDAIAARARELGARDVTVRDQNLEEIFLVAVGDGTSSRETVR